MPGYVIHLAIGKEYAKRNKIKDEESFFRGIIMPDLLDKKTSHYGEASSDPDLAEFLNKNPLDTEYNKGYFLHLITDYLFYNRFLNGFSQDIYGDYNKLNKFLIDKYGIEIPEELQGIVKFSEGEPTILDKNSICKFIEAVAGLDLEKVKGKRDFDDESFEK